MEDIKKTNGGASNLVVKVGVALAAYLVFRIFNNDSRIKTKKKKKRIFISFSIDDEQYRNHLVAQAKNDRTPFSFVDMSVKKPWNEEVWKQKCRRKIKSCDAVIVLLSKNTLDSEGALWEIDCAKKEKIPVRGMYINKNNRSPIPAALNGQKIITWSWDNLANIINKV